MMVYKAGNQRMLVRIANRGELDQTASPVLRLTYLLQGLLQSSDILKLFQLVLSGDRTSNL